MGKTLGCGTMDFRTGQVEKRSGFGGGRHVGRAIELASKAGQSSSTLGPPAKADALAQSQAVIYMGAGYS